MIGNGRVVMLHTIGELLECSVVDSGGTIGHIRDAYFDDTSWEIRYLLLEVLDGAGVREVLFSPDAITGIDKELSRLLVERLSTEAADYADCLSNLRSSRTVLGCDVASWTGALGHAQDVIFETDSWILMFLLVDANCWCPGGVVFVQPTLIENASWDQPSLRLATTHVALLTAPSDDLAAGEDDDSPVFSAQRTLH
jgi:hypothetical protein